MTLVTDMLAAYRRWSTLIKVTGLNNKEFYLNDEIIEKIEQVPETIITLTNGKKYIVLEKPDIVIERVIEYKRKIFKQGE